jgi:hypothetical protein
MASREVEVDADLRVTAWRCHACGQAMEEIQILGQPRAPIRYAVGSTMGGP